MDRRYSKGWPALSRKVRQATGHRCTCCHRRATEVHHGYYGFGPFHLRLPIAGHEAPGWQVFPLCPTCHDLAHQRYRAYKGHPWRNHNDYGYLWGLRARYWLKFGPWCLLDTLVAVVVLGVAVTALIMLK